MAMGFTSMSAYGQLSRGDRYSGAPWATRSPVLAQHGMAATEQPLASQIAIDILKKGGSAVDAAIAANAAIGLMQPVLNGIGGDLFAIVWDPKTKKLYGYNGSGRARDGPRSREDAGGSRGGVQEGRQDPIAAYSADGFAADHRAGRGRCMVRAAREIRQAAHGRRSRARHRLRRRTAFPSRSSSRSIWKGNMAAFEKNKALIEELDNARATYLIDGRTPAEGEIFRNPDLAHTLTLLAEGRSRRLSTKARSRTRSTPISSASAAICATRISRRITANG